MHRHQIVLVIVLSAVMAFHPTCSLANAPQAVKSFLNGGR